MASMQFPALAEIVPGKLVCKIFLHEQATVEGAVRCWSYVSEGLWAIGHKEIIFTLKLLPGEAPENCPELPFQFFGLVYGMAAKGQLVDVGGYTDFGPNGFLGRRAVGYGAPGEFDDFVSLSPSISAILLTEEELGAYGACGLSRVQALLGRSHSYFPYPHWSDRRRASVVAKDDLARSRVAKWPNIRLNGATAALEAGELVLRLPQKARYRLAQDLRPMGDDAAVVLILDIDPQADGCLVWEPNAAGPPAMIAAPGVAKPARMAACHLTIASSQDADGFRVLEDGFVLLLTVPSWKNLRQALEGGRPVSLPAGNQKFHLVWTPAPAVEMRGAWLVSSAKDLKARVGGVPLSDYASTVAAAVVEGVADIGLDGAKHDIRLQLTLTAGKPRAEAAIKTLPAVPTEVIEFLKGQVEALRAPAVRGESIVLEFLFGVKGGTGTLKILE